MTVREGLGEDAVRERERLAFVAGAGWMRESLRRFAPALTQLLEDTALAEWETVARLAADAAYVDPVEADLRTLEKKYGEEAVHRVIRRRMGF